MATTIRTAHHANAAPLSERLSDFRSNLAERFAQYRTYRTTLNELAMLTDRELADMGMHRSNIREIAFEAAYKV